MLRPTGVGLLAGDPFGSGIPPAKGGAQGTAKKAGTTMDAWLLLGVITTGVYFRGLPETADYSVSR